MTLTSPIQDLQRDADFNKALHGKSATSEGGIRAMMGKNMDAQKAAVTDYFKHWDDKSAAEETEETRKSRRDEYASLTRQYDAPHYDYACRKVFDHYVVTTTSPPTSTNTDGAPLSISAASPMENPSDKQLLAMSTTSLI